MSWRIPLFGSQQQQQQPEPNFQNISTQSWYPPSVGGSSSHPSTPSSSGASPHQRASDHPPPSSRGQPSPAEAAGIIARLRDKSVDELQRLLKDKEAYNAFFNSLDQVKTQNNLRDELRKETLQLARENLEKEQRISELRNQCTIIRTTELAAAEDRLAEIERQKDRIMKSYSPAALLDKLQSTMAKLDEESEELHQKFLEKDVDLPTFVQKYKKLRGAHHKCALIHLSGKASLPCSSDASPHQRASDHPQPSSRGQPSSAKAAGIIAHLRDKSVDELLRLLKDKDSYIAFFNSLDQVKTQNNLRDELRKETLQLSRENLEKEQRISELRNQCTIIRTTELAAAEDRLAELARKKDEIMKSYSPAALLDKLQSTMAKLDEESEELHQKFLEKDVDLPTFVQKYKKLRAAHHKCALHHLSGKASLR